MFCLKFLTSMLHQKFKEAASNAKPYAEKLIVDTAKGYMFGCVFSLFTSSKSSLYQSMHKNGKNFAKMSAAYSVTEMTLEKVRNSNDSVNSLTAGALAGALGSKKGILPGALFFGVYSGLSSYFNNDK